MSPRTRTYSLTAPILLAAALLSPRAQAQEWTPLTQGNRLGGEFDGWFTKDATVLNWAVLAQIRMVEHLYLDAELPFGYGSSNFNGVNAPGAPNPQISAFVFGNPYIGLHYATFVSNDVALFVGGGVNIPTLINTNGNAAAVAASETATRAGYDSERFEVETFSFKGRLGLEARIAPHFFYRGEVVPVFLFPFGNDNPFRVKGDPYFFPEMANEFEVRADMGFGGGLRLQQQAFLGRGIANRFSGAAEPFIGYEPHGSGFYFRTGLLIAMTEPYGFGFDTDKVATLRVSMGGKW